MKCSEQTDKLGAALAAFQGAITNPKKTHTVKTNKYTYGYATLDEMLDHVRPVMATHGLAHIQSLGSDDDGPSVTTRVIHSSGQWVESDAAVWPTSKKDPQGYGGASSYARRYSLAAMLGIFAETDDDCAEVKSGVSDEVWGGLVARLANAADEGQFTAALGDCRVAFPKMDKTQQKEIKAVIDGEKEKRTNGAS